MPGKILRRCTLCKKFHASYLVDDPELGKCYLCYTCWKARFSAKEKQQTNESRANADLDQSKAREETYKAFKRHTKFARRHPLRIIEKR